MSVMDMNKLTLYHYTSNFGMKGILNSGEIFKGSLAVDPRVVRNEFAVSLTNDESPIGHGLPDGREISKQCAERLGYCIHRNGKYFSLDHTQFRLEIHIPKDDENLIYIPDFFNGQSEFLNVMEASGYHPLLSDLDDLGKTLFDTLLKIKSGRLDGKGKTWWIYKSTIPINWIHEIRATHPSGHFSYLNIQQLIEASLISK